MAEREEGTRSATLQLKVIPRSSRRAAEFLADGSLKIWLTAAAIDGEANRALVEYLAKMLKVARGKIEIVKGDRSRAKLVKIWGLSEDVVRERLEGSNE